MYRRLIVLAVVFATALMLMFLNSKVLVGEQELQAQLQLVSPPEAADRLWKVTFTDLGGNGVLATTHEQQLVTTRLAGSERIPKIPVKSVSAVTPDHAIEVTGGPDVSETDLKRRLQGSPFKRPNEPKSFWHVNPGIDLRGGVEFVCQLRNELGISQEALGYAAEVDRTYVTDVENGRRNVSVEILERLIGALEVTMAEFFNSKEFKK